MLQSQLFFLCFNCLYCIIVFYKGSGKAKEVDHSEPSCHDVATPPITPPPVVEATIQDNLIQATPPMSPESIISPQQKYTQPMSPPKPSAPVEIVEGKEEEIEEEEIEDELEQPDPIMMSVAVGTDRSMSTQSEPKEKRRSPSPKSPTPRSMHSESSLPSR